MCGGRDTAPHCPLPSAFHCCFGRPSVHCWWPTSGPLIHETQVSPKDGSAPGIALEEVRSQWQPHRGASVLSMRQEIPNLSLGFDSWENSFNTGKQGLSQRGLSQHEALG